MDLMGPHATGFASQSPFPVAQVTCGRLGPLGRASRAIAARDLAAAAQAMEIAEAAGAEREKANVMCLEAIGPKDQRAPRATGHGHSIGRDTGHGRDTAMMCLDSSSCPFSPLHRGPR